MSIMKKNATNKAIRESFSRLPNTMSIVMNEGKQDEYQEYFKEKLKQWGVSSPAELSEEDKKKFFTEIKNEWKKVNEAYTYIVLSKKHLPLTTKRIVESEAQKEYQEYFKEKLKQWGVSSPAELSEEDKKKFFTEIKNEWKGAVNEAKNYAKTVILRKLKENKIARQTARKPKKK